MSHFSTVKTHLRKREPLLQALKDLGYVPQEGERSVRGYRGQTVTAELAVIMPEGGDIGFRLNSTTGAYELVTDLDLWRQSVPVERFLLSSPSATPLIRCWHQQRRKALRWQSSAILMTALSNWW